MIFGSSLSVVSVLSGSGLVLVFRYICVWLSLSLPLIWLIHSIHSSCFLSLILQLRLVRYAVPLVMIGCLYYKVCHFLGGLCSSLYCRSHYRAEPICMKHARKGKWLKWKFWKKITSNWVFITGYYNGFFPCIYFAVYVYYSMQYSNEMLLKTNHYRFHILLYSLNDH